MPSFEDMGLRQELLNALEGEDLSAPSALQEAVIPSLRRGGNLAARASSGSGKTVAYTLGVLDRIEAEAPEEDDTEGVALRVLVLVPTLEGAEAIAVSMVPFAQALGLDVAVPGGGWGTPAEQAAIVVSDPPSIMTAVRGSGLKLDHLDAVIVDGASTIVELGEWDRVDGILDLIPRDAQRVVFSPAFSDEVEDLVARRVKRALRYPPEPAIADERGTLHQGEVGFVLTPEHQKLGLLTRQLRTRDPGAPAPVIFCRTDERAAELAEQLAIRGFLVGEPGEADADVAIAAGDLGREELGEEAEGELGQSISYDVPADAATLVSRHVDDPDGVVLLQPRELSHLKEIARQVRYRVRSAPVQDQLPSTGQALASFRSELRRAIQEEDLTAQLLVLEPLLEEFTAGEVAAAAAALLRRRRPATPPPAPQPEPPPGPATKGRTSEPRSTPTGPAPTTWARLFVSIGNRDDVRPGDLVGALAGEANIPGSRIGKIEIRDSFSLVEVEAEVAEQVIKAVNGTTVKGRSVRVDFDRGGPARRPPTRGGPPRRRTERRPPRGDS